MADNFFYQKKAETLLKMSLLSLNELKEEHYEKKYLLFYLFLFCLVSDDNSFLSKATLAIKSRNYKEALVHISKAENNNQKNPELFRLKALTYEMLDEPLKARIAWKKCLKYSKDLNIKREAKIISRIFQKLVKNTFLISVILFFSSCWISSSQPRNK